MMLLVLMTMLIGMVMLMMMVMMMVVMMMMRRRRMTMTMTMIMIMMMMMMMMMMMRRRRKMMMWMLRRRRRKSRRRRRREEDADVEEDDVEEEDRSQDREAHLARACAIEIHMDIAQQPFCLEIYKKMPDAPPAARFVRACAVEMCMDMSEEAFCAEIYKENAGRFSHGQRFVRACAVEMHMDMLHFVRKFTGKMPDAFPAASVLCEPAQSKCTWTCQKSHLAFCAEIYKENAGRLSRGQRFVRACAIDMHMAHVRRAILSGNFKKMPDAPPAASVLCEPAQSKCTWTMSEEGFCAEIYKENAGRFSRGQRFCASLRSRNAHRHVRRGILCGNLQENAGRFSRGQRFVRACAVEMRMDMSEEAFCAEIYKENAGRPGYHLN